MHLFSVFCGQKNCALGTNGLININNYCTHFIKLTRWQLSGVAIGWMKIFPDGNLLCQIYQGGNFPGEDFPDGNFPGANFSGREFFWVEWELSRWELSWEGIFFGGSFPSGTFHIFPHIFCFQIKLFIYKIIFLFHLKIWLCQKNFILNKKIILQRSFILIL